MSEITTLIVDEPASAALAHSAPQLQSLIVSVKPVDDDVPSKSPYLSALWRRIGERWNATALLLLGMRGDYVTSSIFLPLDDGDHLPAHVRFSGTYREDLERVVKFALDASTTGQILFVSESTYFLKGDDRTRRYEDFPIVGPLTLERFLTMHDQDILRERTIYRIVAGLRSFQSPGHKQEPKV
jgi:hypothetical protein